MMASEADNSQMEGLEQEFSPKKYTISCTDVPEDLFDVEVSKKHFSKFGRISKILLRPKKQSCVIEYDTYDGAAKAILNAGAYDGFMFNVTWLRRKRLRSKKEDDTAWKPNDEIEEELKAMSGASLMKSSRLQSSSDQSPGTSLRKSTPSTIGPVPKINLTDALQNRQRGLRTKSLNKISPTMVRSRLSTVKTPIYKKTNEIMPAYRKHPSMITSTIDDDGNQVSPQRSRLSAIQRPIFKKAIEEIPTFRKHPSMLKSTVEEDNLGMKLIQKETEKKKVINAISSGFYQVNLVAVDVTAMLQPPLSRVCSLPWTTSGATIFTRISTPPNVSQVSIISSSSVNVTEAIAEIKSLRTRQARSVEDRFRILELRDKALRIIGGTGNRDPRKGAISGTCPDMCPEKERLRREVESQMASFEYGSGVADPARTVKRYSRSSADQEAPMCYELRPPFVLKQAMLHLLHNVADLSEDEEDAGKIGEWFHFMWDRLRSIRKDITQQALCCEDSVCLMEQCARFHAHCSARLAGLDSSMFDQRLNSDNLTKCLQTLKHLYDDLRMRGAPKYTRRNEPEFRGYVALLNLGDANFMWEIQQLEPEIQRSSEIRFTLKTFIALDNNNYIRFFRLLKEATYLQACILLRYFNDVRARALARIIKAYVPKGTTHFPAQELMENLAFEDMDKMELFLNHYGIKIRDKEDETVVVLDKAAFSDESEPYPVSRAIETIESKRSLRVGEMIAGDRLERYVPIVPHNSFDSNGYIKESSLFALDQGYKLPDKFDAPSARSSIFSDASKQITVPVTIRVKPENIFKMATAAPVPAIFTFKPALSVDGGTPNRPITSSALDNQFIFSKPSEVTSPKATGMNVFATPSENIFSTAPKTSIFGAKDDNVFGKASGNIFAKSEEPKNIFASSNIFGGAAIFGKPSENIFAQPPTALFKTDTAEDTFRAAAIQKEEEKKAREEEQRKAEEEERHKEECRKEERRKEEQRRKEKEEEEKKRVLALKMEEEKRLAAIQQMKQKEEDEKKRKLEAEKKRKEILLEKVEKDSEDLLRRTIDEVNLETVRADIDLELTSLRALMDFASERCDSVIYDVCAEECASFIKSERFRRKRLVKKYGGHWINVTALSVKRRLALSNTPAWLPNQPADALAKSSLPSILSSMHEFHRGRGFAGLPDAPPDLNPIDVFSVVKDSLLLRANRLQENCVFWNVVVSTPDSKEVTDDRIDLRNIVRALYGSYDQANHVLYLKECSWQKRFAICVSETSAGIDTASALLIYIYNRSDLSTVDERIERLIDSTCNYQLIPIAVIAPGLNVETIAAIEEKLNYYKSTNVILNYKILTDSKVNAEVYSDLSLRALPWLARRLPVKPPIEINLLKDLLHQCIGNELWYRIKLEEYSTIRTAFTKLPIMIDLYNEALKRTKAILLNEHVLLYASFPKAFRLFIRDDIAYPAAYERFPIDWKSRERFRHISEALNTCGLPNISLQWPPSTPSSLQMWIKDFCTQTYWFTDPEETAIKIISLLPYWLNDPSMDEIQLNDFGLTNLFRLIVSEKIESVSSKCKIKMAVYAVSDLQNHRSTHWWYSIPKITALAPTILPVREDYIDQLLEGEKRRKRQRLEDDSFTDCDATLVEDAIKEAEKSIESFDRSRGLCEELDRALDKVSKKASEFEYVLTSVMEN